METLVIRLALFVLLYGIDFAYSITIADMNDYPFQYFYAGLAGIFTVCMLGFFRYSKIARDLQVIHITWIAVHAYGYVIYMLYLPPDSYNQVQIILHIAQIFRLLWNRHDDTNPVDDYYRVSDVPYHDFNLRRICFKR